MGLFRCIAARERRWLRYLCDASYWIYLGHLPLVMALQALVVDWPLHYHAKFLVVCTAAAAVLMVTYRYLIRYTFIGRMLNGPRVRLRARAAPPP